MKEKKSQKEIKKRVRIEIVSLIFFILFSSLLFRSHSETDSLCSEQFYSRFSLLWTVLCQVNEGKQERKVRNTLPFIRFGFPFLHVFSFVIFMLVFFNLIICPLLRFILFSLSLHSSHSSVFSAFLFFTPNDVHILPWSAFVSPSHDTFFFFCFFFLLFSFSRIWEKKDTKKSSSNFFIVILYDKCLSFAFAAIVLKKNDFLWCFSCSIFF